MRILCQLLAIAVFAAANFGTLAAPKRARMPEGPLQMEGARTEVYKVVGDTKLNAYIFTPKTEGTNRPAIVFFFGGGWTTGSPKQFEGQCRHFADRGMVAISADYRVKSRNGVAVTACVEDAKSCIRWVRKNAARLGVDPNRIVAAGGSAGGHIAAATGTLPDFDTDADAKSVSSVPNAMVLFNPVLVLAPVDNMPPDEFQRKLTRERLGTDPEKLSPIHHIKPGQPPMIVFHGKADTTVPYFTTEAFVAASKKAGNRCELIGYEGQKHGFFNDGRGSGIYYTKTLNAADDFLVSLGFLKPAPSRTGTSKP